MIASVPQIVYNNVDSEDKYGGTDMKLWGGRFRKEENQMMEDFNSSFPFDQRLYREDITGSIAPVSYTHLDVYKRQVQM